MRTTASVLHLDLDAFFASVEQRDKPSLRGKPVIVGGVGGRGVVSTASYEARPFGVHSAMPMHEARRLCPHAAVLSGRFGAYREASAIVMGLLRELSPLVEPLSLDEAFVDLATDPDRDLTPSALVELAERLRADVQEQTGGLTASVGLGSSKFMAKVATELGKPNGVHLVEPGTEVPTLAPLPARAIPGVGPATMERLARLGVETVADVQALSERELVRELGRASGLNLYALAFARDDRPVVAEREVKSISVEDTFATDLTDRAELDAAIDRDARIIAGRLAKHGWFARTITLKVKRPDFTTIPRSQTLHGSTDRSEVIGRIARSLLGGLEIGTGFRLLGVGVSGFSEAAQEELFEPEVAGAVVQTAVANPSGQVVASHAEAGSAEDTHADADAAGQSATGTGQPEALRPRWQLSFTPGADVEHDEYGRGWVWGSCRSPPAPTSSTTSTAAGGSGDRGWGG
ncbi:DNA polymerase IV [Nigerium massiliense]|uniref:DNA polymerase IV n=1 Tax=Nigerium massiliense TaxID=1522317 RepID=UPI000A560796|nr:DNA polymerase IV [Nigerium massiliense]